jgi:hypothetical protein
MPASLEALKLSVVAPVVLGAYMIWIWAILVVFAMEKVVFTELWLGINPD